MRLLSGFSVFAVTRVSGIILMISFLILDNSKINELYQSLCFLRLLSVYVAMRMSRFVKLWSAADARLAPKSERTDRLGVPEIRD